ncbi:MAG: hypothetical protein QOC78_2085 [Solirubrobacteraceae bacterium]|nr:hypothetical protein [Solirubrobacteraceae bacterium]
MQLEFPWALGPPDGRYVLRGHAAAPEHVLVLTTLGAPERRRLRGRRARAASPAPAPVATARATLVSARRFETPREAEAWLRDVANRTEASEAEVREAVTALNRVLHHQRVAAADPHVRQVGREQALVVRLGIGDGEAMAEGRWTRAVELPAPRGRERRDAALRPQERLAALLGGRDAVLACEDLALRAREDLDAGRRREAALQLQAALAAALVELEPWAGRGDLAARLAELGELRDGVHAVARRALEGGVDDEAAATAAHALARLEAALRARTAAGFD